MLQESCTGMNIDCFPAEVQVFISDFLSVLAKQSELKDAETVEAREQELQCAAGQLLAKVLERDIQQSIDSASLKEEERQLIKGWPKKLKNRGMRAVTLQTSWGIIITVKARYFSGNGRSAQGKGLYGALQLLGLYNHCTPVTGSEVARTVAALGSLEEARNELQQRGIILSINTLRRIAYQWSERVRNRLSHSGLQFADQTGQRRVVVSSDGGRVRIRRHKKGVKTRKGRSRYHTDWKEPKLLIIYAVDEQGLRDKHFLPYLDGTMKGPDVLYGYLRFYLGKLAITQAEHVVFISDGAPWIWDRLPALIADLGLSQYQVFRVLDFYHAVEHLAKLTQLQTRWTTKARKSWLTKHRRLLKAGKVELVIDAIRSLGRGRHKKAIHTELNYFIKHKGHMTYDKLKALNLPIGSGAIESAIRRVLNQRIKGPAIYWKEKSAEAIILLRSYFKAGRWNTLKRIALAPKLEAIV